MQQQLPHAYTMRVLHRIVSYTMDVHTNSHHAFISTTASQGQHLSGTHTPCLSRHRHTWCWQHGHDWHSHLHATQPEPPVLGLTSPAEPRWIDANMLQQSPAWAHSCLADSRTTNNTKQQRPLPLHSRRCQPERPANQLQLCLPPQAANK